MGNGEVKPYDFKWINKYELIDFDDNDKLLKIMSRVGESEYFGKEYEIYGEQKINQMQAIIDKKVLTPCPYLMKLVRVGVKTDTMNCNQSKIFCLIFQKPFKTIKQESIERKLQCDPYTDDDILCCLESCVRALNYLRQMGQFHSRITSSNIFIDEDRTVLLGDPWLFHDQKDFNQNIHGNTYPSPQKILYRNGFIGEPDVFLSDLFSLGITLLEMYFFEHMDVVYQKGQKRILEMKLIQRINKISSKELRNKLKIILSHEPLKRYQILKEFCLVDSKAEIFANYEKESFKKEYIRKMLVTSQVKTVKMSRKDYEPRQRTVTNRFNTSRAHSDISYNTVNERMMNLSEVQHQNQRRGEYQNQVMNPSRLDTQNEQRVPFVVGRKDEVSDDKSIISSIAKHESEFSREILNLDLFDSDKRYSDPYTYKNDKRIKMLKRSNLMNDHINTATVNNKMNEDKGMKRSEIIYRENQTNKRE